eukprot:scaffold2188_cov32-Tisochrysis_lutea.AAC.6
MVLSSTVDDFFLVSDGGLSRALSAPATAGFSGALRMSMAGAAVRGRTCCPPSSGCSSSSRW